MMMLMIIAVIIPGILINLWFTRRDKAKKQRGFEVITGQQPMLSKDETTGPDSRAD